MQREEVRRQGLARRESSVDKGSGVVMPSSDGAASALEGRMQYFDRPVWSVFDAVKQGCDGV